MTKHEWDHVDFIGMKHRRLARAALHHLKKAMKSGDRDSVEAWSRTYTRHMKRENLVVVVVERPCAG